MNQTSRNTHPRFDVRVKLEGEDGNAFAIMGRVKKALRKAGATDVECKEFLNECMSGDYNHLLKTCVEWVDVL